MLKRLSILVVFGALAAGFGPAMAADANSEQIYNALRAGHTAEAEQMINQVLRDYPRNAKAHYVAAEVYARAGDYPRARAELSTAQILDPSGGFANPRSIQELQTQLNGGARRVQGSAPGFAVPARRSSVPWGLIIVLVAAVAIIWMLAARRRSQYYGANYPTGVPGAPGAAPGYGPGYGPGAGYGPGPGYGPGGGSGLMGSLGTGLAVGAGVAAGEELTRHVLGGGGGGVIPSAEAGEPVPPPANEDMGGQDFGVNDPGSWDDGGGGGGGGGDWGGGGGDGGGDWT